MRLETVRHLGPADRLVLLDLWVGAWAAVMPDLDFEARRSWMSGHLDDLVGRGALVLLTRGADERIAGFATLDPETGDLDQLAVDRQYQGRGIARGLLDEAKRRCPAGLHLSVNASNDRAIALYERAGFVLTGTAVNSRSGLPVWTMRWSLADDVS